MSSSTTKARSQGSSSASRRKRPSAAANSWGRFSNQPGLNRATTKDTKLMRNDVAGRHLRRISRQASVDTAASEWHRNMPYNLFFRVVRVFRGSTLKVFAVVVLMVSPREQNASGADWQTHRGNAQRTGAADELPGPK